MLCSLRGDYMKEKRLEEKAKYDKQYYHDHISRVVLNFNERVPEDAALYKWLQGVGKGNYSAYIKALILEDMDKHGPD